MTDSEILEALIELLEKEPVTINRDDEGYWLECKLNRSFGGDHDTCKTARESVETAIRRWKENET
jgi:hypothetical protein